MSNTTTFTDYITPIVAAWLNDVNAVAFTALADGSHNPPTTAAQVRTNLSLGTMALQASTAVAITGGTIAGATITGGTISGTTISTSTISSLSTPLSITYGGTGAASASAARTALGAAASGANTDITTLSAPAIGAATATTASASNSSTLVATTAYVNSRFVQETVNSSTAVTYKEWAIPSWAKQIVISIADTSTSGTSDLVVQIGSGGAILLTGYTGVVATHSAASTASAFSNTNGFTIINGAVAAATYSGRVTLTLVDAATNTWACDSCVSRQATTVTQASFSGSNSTVATLSVVRVTTTGGTDTFDAGKINIQYA